MSWVLFFQILCLLFVVAALVQSCIASWYKHRISAGLLVRNMPMTDGEWRRRIEEDRRER